ncbi:hypothetical protein ACIGPN_30340 [Streptomyces afghaniensis]|uniref:hypothetical protein n=1 Tax=Streptomyces afghaniensis TaxID=66865 RepID=UPI0037D7BE34
MLSDFISMVSERDPALAEILATRIEEMQAADAGLAREAEAELAELHRSRPKSVFESGDGHTIEEFFRRPMSPSSELVERRARIGLAARLVIEKMEQRHHGVIS